MTNSIEVLSAILSSREDVVRGEAFGKPADLAPLIAAGLIVPAGHVTSALCTECSEPHLADVVSFSCSLGFHCAEVGFVETFPESVAAFSVRPDCLAEKLSTAIGVTGKASSWPREEPVVWSIGAFEFQTGVTAVFLAANVSEPIVLNELTRYLEQPHGHPHGIAILTNDARDFELIRLPGGAKILSLGDVCEVKADGSLTFNREVVALRALPARFVRLAPTGRPATSRELVIRILSELDQAGRIDGLEDREVERAVRPEFRRRSGKKSGPGRGTFLAAFAEYRSRRSE